MLTPSNRAAILRLYDVDHRRRTGQHRFTLNGQHYSIRAIGAALETAWGLVPATSERYREIAIHYAGERDGSPGRSAKFRERFLAADGNWVVRRPGVLYRLPVSVPK